MEKNLINIKDTRFNYNNLKSKFLLIYLLDESKVDCKNIENYICPTGINLALVSLTLQSSSYKKMYNEISKIQLYKHLNKKQKETIYNLINFNQKIKFIIYKFIFRIKTKIKKNKDSWNKETLQLTDISEITEKNILKLYYSCKYFTFDAKEIAFSINKTLLRNEYMFPNPCFPKNPWNNVPFSYGALCAIYSHLIKNNIQVPLCFMMFKKCNFNIKLFKKKFHNFLSENAIKDFIYSLDNNTLINTAIEEITKVAEYEGWIHKLPPTFPRFDTFCKICFKKWIESNIDKIDYLKGIIYKYNCNANLKHIHYKVNIINILGIKSTESEYFLFKNDYHKKHMFIPKKKINDEVVPSNNHESLYEIVSEWITVGDQNFNRGQEETQPLTSEQMLIDLEEHDL